MGAAPPQIPKVDPAKRASHPIHDIPSLDGLRAVSIAIVVLSHTRALLPAKITNAGLFRYLIGGGLHGVQIFFVLSGYLITTLLLREYVQTGAVSFRRFYVRRALRIFPAFYTYFALLAILCAAGVISIHWPTYLASAAYLFVYVPHPQGWYVEHSWSLSIEEQFYLLWPALLLFVHRRQRSIALVLSVLAAMPFIRIALASTVPNAERAIVTTGSIDTLLVGCLLALIAQHPHWRELHRRFINGWSVSASLAIGFILVPYASAKMQTVVSSLSLSACYATVTSVAIGAMVAYVIVEPRSLVGRLLNLPVMRHIGVISYSIYLWQQVFTANPRQFGFSIYLLILVAAELSFWLIEKPMMRLRARFAPLA
jgi:peptidoglycan/LPS O-acetylase OafA/YrhL